MKTFQERLQERRIQFLLRAKEKLATIKVMLGRLESDSSDYAALNVINQHFHQLVGAGGIYEMSDLCDLAIAGEDICIGLIRDNSPVRQVDRERVEIVRIALLDLVRSHAAG